MAIFLKQLKVHLNNDKIQVLNLTDAWFRLTPIEIMPKTIVSDTSLFPYNCFLEQQYDSDDTRSEYLGIIYFTKAELDLIEEHGVDYFETLVHLA